MMRGYELGVVRTVNPLGTYLIPGDESTPLLSKVNV